MNTNKTKIVLKKNKALDKIWHPESTTVFKSDKDKLVIGRYENNTFIPLDEKTIELCVKWKFKYDETLSINKYSKENNEESKECSDEESKECSDEESKECSDEESNKEICNQSEEENNNPDNYIKTPDKEISKNEIVKVSILENKYDIESSKEKISSYIQIFTESSNSLCTNIKEFVYNLEKYHISHLKYIQTEHESVIKQKDIVLKQTQEKLNETVKELEETKYKLFNVRKVLEL